MTEASAQRAGHPQAIEKCDADRFEQRRDDDDQSGDQPNHGQGFDGTRQPAKLRGTVSMIKDATPPGPRRQRALSQGRY